MEYLTICQEMDFPRVVVSLKSSNTRIIVQANRLLVQNMKALGMDYPLHLGVTESGNDRQGRLKSAVGIITLLKEGIGDTFRVSLTEAPGAEIRFGKLFLPVAKDRSQPASWDELIVSAAYKWAPGLLDGTIDWKTLPMPFIEAPFASKEELKEFCMDLLQATRCVFSSPEYISCPGCGRTKFNLEETVRQVKKATSHLKGCTIAVMGCIVNGPGEMADAQYGYVGEGNGKVTLYKGKIPVMRGIPQEEAVQRLLELIESQQK
jgi:(E)-4-hydroxy-3-methylbut-2-enyl-diphosphate synthase